MQTLPPFSCLQDICSHNNTFKHSKMFPSHLKFDERFWLYFLRCNVLSVLPLQKKPLIFNAVWITSAIVLCGRHQKGRDRELKKRARRKTRALGTQESALYAHSSALFFRALSFYPPLSRFFHWLMLLKVNIKIWKIPFMWQRVPPLP